MPSSAIFSNEKCTLFSAANKPVADSEAPKESATLEVGAAQGRFVRADPSAQGRSVRSRPFSFFSYNGAMTDSGHFETKGAIPAAALRLHVLASGSKGNAAVVENVATGQGILVDCGICKRDFLGRCSQVGFAVEGLRAVLVTHDHTDHTKGLAVLYRELARRGIRPPLATSEPVRAASAPVREVLEQGLCEFVPLTVGSDGATAQLWTQKDCFENIAGSNGAAGPENPPVSGRNEHLVKLGMETLTVAGIRVTPFRTSHDAAESFGFRFECAGDAMGFLTDSGIVPDSALERLRDVRILALESNHDPQMLANGPYPWPLKQRVASERGHLSNDQAAATLTEMAGPRLQAVVAMHISQNNNTYRLPQVVLQQALARIGHGATVHIAYQDRPITVG